MQKQIRRDTSEGFAGRCRILRSLSLKLLQPSSFSAKCGHNFGRRSRTFCDEQSLGLVLSPWASTRTYPGVHSATHTRASAHTGARARIAEDAEQRSGGLSVGMPRPAANDKTCAHRCLSKQNGHSERKTHIQTHENRDPQSGRTAGRSNDPEKYMRLGAFRKKNRHTQTHTHARAHTQTLRNTHCLQHSPHRPAHVCWTWTVCCSIWTDSTNRVMSAPF
mmetsp:Transcript_43386/g.70702  ORF Transcript_43386/g.70702 Transcript_43386/m.70702 type:complete len:220 (+) Transcript_43386:1861-2520(+)